MAATLVAVQKAVLAAIRASVTGLTPVPAVYDDVPQNAAMPFVEIGRHVLSPQNLLADAHDLHQVTLAVWSDRRGQREVLQILDAIRAGVDDADLTLDSGGAYGCRVTRLDTSLNTDGDVIAYVGSATIELQIDREI